MGCGARLKLLDIVSLSGCIVIPQQRSSLAGKQTSSQLETNLAYKRLLSTSSGTYSPSLWPFILENGFTAESWVRVALSSLLALPTSPCSHTISTKTDLDRIKMIIYAQQFSLAYFHSLHSCHLIMVRRYRREMSTHRPSRLLSFQPPRLTTATEFHVNLLNFAILRPFSFSMVTDAKNSETLVGRLNTNETWKRDEG